MARKSGPGRLAAVAAFVTFTMVLAGCTSASAGTALANEGAANAAADSEWAEDAQLVAIVGIEGQGADAWDQAPWGGVDDDDLGELADCFDAVEEDANVGDGKAEIWAYAYVAESKPDVMYVVVVGRSGDVLCQKEVPFEDSDEGGMAPIGEWSMNSDAALDVAVDRNEDIKAVLASESYYVVFVMGRNPGTYENAVWFVSAFQGMPPDGSEEMEDDDGPMWGTVVVDAVEGNVVLSWGSSSDGMPAMPG